MAQFLGKYRATVRQNLDPDRRGRLQLHVPDVLGDESSAWAEACVPLAGPPGAPMGVYLVPPLGTGVWVEFEQGDPQRPVWVGCRWAGAASVPPSAQAGEGGPVSIVVQSPGQHLVMLSDAPATEASGGIVLRSAGNATIVVNDSGIFIDNGKGASIALVGPTVSVNEGALAVT